MAGTLPLWLLAVLTSVLTSAPKRVRQSIGNVLMICRTYSRVTLRTAVGLQRTKFIKATDRVMCSSGPGPRATVLSINYPRWLTWCEWWKENPLRQEARVLEFLRKHWPSFRFRK